MPEMLQTTIQRITFANGGEVLEPEGTPRRESVIATLSFEVSHYPENKVAAMLLLMKTMTEMIDGMRKQP